jgi:predicted carbohydrate-binding protein with CBM5 and CBM33 domain
VTVTNLLRVALTASLFASAPVAAQVRPQSQPAPAATPKAAVSDPVICEKEEELGSRLAAKKICHTRSQWQELRMSDRSVTERAQQQRAMRAEGN